MRRWSTAVLPLLAAAAVVAVVGVQAVAALLHDTSSARAHGMSDRPDAAVAGQDPTTAVSTAAEPRSTQRSAIPLTALAVTVTVAVAGLAGTGLRPGRSIFGVGRRLARACRRAPPPRALPLFP